jgi:hypothetical protein
MQFRVLRQSYSLVFQQKSILVDSPTAQPIGIEPINKGFGDL